MTQGVARHGMEPVVSLPLRGVEAPGPGWGALGPQTPVFPPAGVVCGVGVEEFHAGHPASGIRGGDGHAEGGGGLDSQGIDAAGGGGGVDAELHHLGPGSWVSGIVNGSHPPVIDAVGKVVLHRVEVLHYSPLVVDQGGEGAGGADLELVGHPGGVLHPGPGEGGPLGGVPGALSPAGGVLGRGHVHHEAPGELLHVRSPRFLPYVVPGHQPEVVQVLGELEGEEVLQLGPEDGPLPVLQRGGTDAQGKGPREGVFVVQPELVVQEARTAIHEHEPDPWGVVVEIGHLRGDGPPLAPEVLVLLEEREPQVKVLRRGREGVEHEPEVLRPATRVARPVFGLHPPPVYPLRELLP